MKMLRYMAIIAALLMPAVIGCSTKNFSDSEIKVFSAFNIETLKRSEYSVLASIKGVGKVTVGAMSVIGDTGKYGYIDEMSSSQSSFQGVVPKEPEMIARRNAIFDAIMHAQKLGADALWMPQFTTVVTEDKAGMVITCTMYAKAIKIKEDTDLVPREQATVSSHVVPVPKESGVQPAPTQPAKPELKKTN